MGILETDEDDEAQHSMQGTVYTEEESDSSDSAHDPPETPVDKTGYSIDNSYAEGAMIGLAVLFTAAVTAGSAYAISEELDGDGISTGDVIEPYLSSCVSGFMVNNHDKVEQSTEALEYFTELL